jgi:uncharacterized membrane protein
MSSGDTSVIKSNKRVITAALMAIAGFADAAYLSVKHVYNADVGCLVAGGCDAVLNSEYATILGIPLSFLGVVFYTTVLVLLAAYLLYEGPLLYHVIKTVVIIGFVFSVYLVHLQLFVLYSLCSWCLFSAAMTIGLTVAFLGSYRPKETP